MVKKYTGNPQNIEAKSLLLHCIMNSDEKMAIGI